MGELDYNALANTIGGVFGNKQTAATPTTAKPGWSDIAVAGITALGSLNGGSTVVKPVTASPTLNNNFNISVPDVADPVTTKSTEVTATFRTDEPTTAKNNTLLYVGIGAGVLVVIVVLFFVLKKK